MTPAVTLRLLILAVSAAVAGFAAVRASGLHGVNRLAIAALATYALANVGSQLTLLNAPITVRTYGSLIASLVGIGYVIAILRNGPNGKT